MYLLDANVFIQARDFGYGFDLCPGFWLWLDKAYQQEKIRSIRNIRDELLEREDDIANWCKERKYFFPDCKDIETYESQEQLSNWVVENYEAEFHAAFLGAADFVLVSHAHANNHAVVTWEVYANGNDVKIPNACKFMNVPFMKPFDMLRAEGVKFVLKE